MATNTVTPFAARTDLVAGIVCRTRAAQGLAPSICDPAALRRIAAMLAVPIDGREARRARRGQHD